MSFKVQDHYHYDLRKHLHVDYNMIFMKSEKVHVMNVIQS